MASDQCDTNVILLVTNPGFTPKSIAATKRTAQVAPTVVKALGLDPAMLEAVVAEGTQSLAEVALQLGQ